MAFAEKGHKLVVDDGKIERIIVNSWNCIVTTADRKEAKGAERERRLVTDASCRICFKVDSYRSNLEFSILKPKNEPDRFQTAYLRFDAQSISQCELQRIENSEYQELCGDEDRVLDHHVCFRLSVRYNDKKLCAESIFTEYCSAYIADLRDHLRSKADLLFYIHGTTKTQTDFEMLQARFEKDAIRHPLRQWYPAYMRHCGIQKGQYLEPEERPSVGTVDPVYTVSDWLDYMTRHGFGHIYNQEHLNNLTDPFAQSLHEMFFFELYGGRNRRIMFFLRTASSDEEVRLLPNDKLAVSFDKERDVTMAWNATVVEPLPYSPLSVVTGYITRPWDKEAKAYKDTRDLKMVPTTRLKDRRQALRRIMSQEPYQVGLRLITSDEPFRRSLTALEYLNQCQAGLIPASPRQHLDVKYLLGNHFDTIQKIDMYEGIAAKELNPEQLMQLNEGQLRAVMKSRSLPAGWLLIHGPPGTGKTYLIVEMLKPFLQDSEHHRVLVCCPNNAGVDNAAQRAHEVLTRLQAAGSADAKKYVVRLHSLETEKGIVEKDAKLNRTVPEDARPQCVQEFGDEELAILNNLDMAKMIHEEYERNTKTKFAGVHDKRVLNLEMSLGHRILQVAGILKDAEKKRFPWAKDPADPLIASFCASYNQYNEGAEMDRARSKSFREQTKSLCELTIDGAEVVACTLATAAVPLVATAYGAAEGLALDESAKVLESDMWPLLQHYLQLHWKLLAGDPFQLGPVVLSSEASNPFFKQMKLSMQHRLISTGATSQFLPEQARAIEDIAKPYNDIVYDGLLAHAASTKKDLRPIARAVEEFNVKTYNLKSNIVYVDLTDGKSKRVATGSIYNDQACQYGLNLLEKLIVDIQIPSVRIAILTCYQAQYRCYQAGIQRMSQFYPQILEMVDVDKIDRCQGSEWDITIVCLTRTEGSGFMRDKARLNVLFSRSRNGLYIISNKKCIDALKRSEGKFLLKFQSKYLRYRSQQLGPTECVWYQPGQVDITDAADEELESDDEDDTPPKGTAPRLLLG